MQTDFCQSLIDQQNDNLKTAINKKLKEIYVPDNDTVVFNQFKNWLETHSCIERVEITQGVLRSNPPIKEFRIFLNHGIKTERERIVSITLFPGDYKME